MRPAPNPMIEIYRLVRITGCPKHVADDLRGTNYGAFEISFKGSLLRVIASGGEEDYELGWEHVSVLLERRCPKWDEMAFVKAKFWEDEEVVLQFHPAKSQYINLHPNCLHMWRHRSIVFPMPPSILVGPKSVASATKAAV